LNFPNLDIISTDRELISSALQLTKECNLNPRNAIHAATAIDKRADVFISTDPHFDKLKRLKRKPL
jgi:predicted nucleic acid-binding protein